MLRRGAERAAGHPNPPPAVAGAEGKVLGSPGGGLSWLCWCSAVVSSRQRFLKAGELRSPCLLGSLPDCRAPCYVIPDFTPFSSKKRPNCSSWGEWCRCSGRRVLRKALFPFPPLLLPQGKPLAGSCSGVLTPQHLVGSVQQEKKYRYSK